MKKKLKLGKIKVSAIRLLLKRHLQKRGLDGACWISDPQVNTIKCSHFFVSLHGSLFVCFFSY